MLTITHNFFNDNRMQLIQHVFNAITNGDNENAKIYLHLIENLQEVVDSSGRTLLHLSVKYENATMIQHLLEKGLDVNACDKRGVTSLLMAVKDMRYSTIIEVLLRNNADVLLADDSGLNSLQWVTEMCICTKPSCLQQRHLVQMLVEKVNMDFTRNKKSVLNKLLMNPIPSVKIACFIFGNEELTKYLLDNDNAIDYCINGSDHTTLHCAIMLGKFDKAKMLIERGANVNAINRAGYTPLYYYASKFQDQDNNSEVLQYLLNHRLNEHSTNLARLFEYGNKQTVKFILQSGIEIHLFYNGNTFFHLLAINENSDAIYVLDELSIQFDVNTSNIFGETALFHAAKCSRVKQVEFLLNHGTDVNLTLISGESVLDYVAVSFEADKEYDQMRQGKIIRLLLLYGAKVSDNLIQNLYQSRYEFLVRDILAHLVFIAKLKQSRSIVILHENIMTNDILKAHVESCDKHLEEMKNIEVYESLTLFQLLSEKNGDKLLTYVGNEEFMMAFNSTMQRLSHLETYYIDILHWRVKRATEKVEADLMIPELSGKLIAL